jgi:E3 SUMO-protein ligase PIAS1
MAAPERIHFFKQSPFFEIREQILGDITLECTCPSHNLLSLPLTVHSASPSHRNTATRTLIINDAVSNRLKEDKSLRLLLLSAQEQALTPYSRVDITFPSQIEVRVNGKEVKSNYKGLKGKPGSTRPADITSCVSITPANTRNTLIVTYALTQKASDHKVFLYSRSPPPQSFRWADFLAEVQPVCFLSQDEDCRRANSCNHQTQRHHQEVSAC